MNTPHHGELRADPTTIHTAAAQSCDALHTWATHLADAAPVLPAHACGEAWADLGSRIAAAASAAHRLRCEHTAALLAQAQACDGTAAAIRAVDDAGAAATAALGGAAGSSMGSSMGSALGSSMVAQGSVVRR